MQYTLASTKQFDKWLRRLKDRATKRKILARLARVENGHFGDFKKLDSSLFELRFFFGNGVRIYFTIRNNEIILLLVGGDKSSQNSDIEKAKRLVKEIE